MPLDRNGAELKRSDCNHRGERADSEASLQSTFKRGIGGALPISPLAARPDDMSHLVTVREQEAFIRSQRTLYRVYDDSKQLYYKGQEEAERQQQESSTRTGSADGSYNVDDDPLVRKLMAQVASTKSAANASRQQVDVGIAGSDQLRHNPSFSGCLAAASKRAFPESVEALVQSFVPNSCAGRLTQPQERKPVVAGPHCDFSRLTEAMTLLVKPTSEGRAARLKRWRNLLAYSQELMISASDKIVKKRLKKKCKEVDQIIQEETDRYRNEDLPAILEAGAFEKGRVDAIAARLEHEEDEELASHRAFGRMEELASQRGKMSTRSIEMLTLESVVDEVLFLPAPFVSLPLLTLTRVCITHISE